MFSPVTIPFGAKMLFNTATIKPGVLGSNESIMKPKIFNQEQIARAVELGLGASSPSEIEVVSAAEKARTIRIGF